MRTAGGGCSGDGFYPSSLGAGNEAYKHKGLDVLADEGSEVKISLIMSLSFHL